MLVTGGIEAAGGVNGAMRDSTETLIVGDENEIWQIVGKLPAAAESVRTVNLNNQIFAMGN